MDYGSLFTTAFKTLRKAPLAWLFSLLYCVQRIGPLGNLGMLVCPAAFLIYYVVLTGQMAVTLSLYNAFHDQRINWLYTWMDASRLLFRCFLYVTLWILLWISATMAAGLLTHWLPLVPGTAMSTAIVTFVSGFLGQYMLLSIIRQKGTSRVMPYVWQIWTREQAAKLLISLLGAIMLIAPHVGIVLALNPGTKVLAITSQQYRSLNFPLLLSWCMPLWSAVTLLIWNSLSLSLYMHIIHEHPELDLAKPAAPVAPSDDIAPATTTTT